MSIHLTSYVLHHLEKGQSFLASCYRCHRIRFYVYDADVPSHSKVMCTYCFNSSFILLNYTVTLDFSTLYKVTTAFKEPRREEFTLSSIDFNYIE